MRRTASQTTRLQAALDRRGFAITARRVEAWGLAGLCPDANLHVERQLDHYCALATVSGKGVTNDTAARRLAARGFPCDRLMPAILRYLNVTEVQVAPRLDFSCTPDGDVAFDAVESAVREMTEKFPDLAPAPFRKLFDAVARNAERWAPHIGEEGEPETGATVLHSYLTSVVCYYHGDNLYGAKNMTAIGNIDPVSADEEMLDLVNSFARLDPDTIDRAYLTANANEVAKMAALLRTYAPKALDAIGVDTLTDTEVDELCAVLGPFFLCLLEHVRVNVPEELFAHAVPILAQAGLWPALDR